MPAADLSAAVAAVFGQAACTGQLCVQSLDGRQEAAVAAGEPVVSASVFKVCVALEVLTAFEDGRLDPAGRVILPAAGTPGPTGFALFSDDAEASLRDLVTAMLTISDNRATDALLHRVGIDAVNAAGARLGLAGTVITADLRTAIDSIGREAGFAGWAQAAGWLDQPHPAAEVERVTARIHGAAALSPAHATRTTPRDMATLLRLVWADQAGPAPACARLRWLMRNQLTRHRLASGFPPPARVAAKSGGLMGVIRNEVGVVEYPGGRGYAMAVFTRTGQPGRDAAVNAAIGTAAARAVAALEEAG